MISFSGIRIGVSADWADRFSYLLTLSVIRPALWGWTDYLFFFAVAFFFPLEAEADFLALG